MTRVSTDPDDLGRDRTPAGVTILTRGWAAVMAALVLGGVYLAGPPRPTPARQVSLSESAGRAHAFAFNSGGEVLAATAIDATIRPWRIDPVLGRAVPSGPAIPGYVAAFAPDGATLAVGDVSTVTLWDTTSDRPRQTLRTEDGRTLALAFSGDGATLAAAGERAVTLWDTASGRERAGARLGLRGVHSLAFSPDGRSLATGDLDGFVRVWDLVTGRPCFETRAHVRYVASLAFSEDGRTLASASRWARVARLWDVASGCGLVSLRGHTGMIQSVTFAPGGRTLVTTGIDDTVRLWDAATGRELAVLRDCGDRLCAAAFSPDGRTLATGGFDQEVRLWDVPAIIGLPPTKAVGP